MASVIPQTQWQKVFQLIQADLLLLNQLKKDGIQVVDVDIEIGHLEEVNRALAHLMKNQTNTNTKREINYDF